MRSFVVRLGLACALTLGACATHRAGPAGSPRDLDVLTRDEIEQTDARTAYDAVARLRPRFLILRGPTDRQGQTPRRVIVDGVPHEDFSALSYIRADEVIEIRFLSSSEATMRFGTGYPMGALLVRTVRAGDSE